MMQQFTVTKNGQTVTTFGRQEGYPTGALRGPTGRTGFRGDAEIIDFTETGGPSTPGYLGIPWWGWLVGGIGLFMLVRR